jgi:uncharacterized RDD family membrane protein YckC
VEARAGFGRRLVAAAIDTAVLGLILVALAAIGSVILVVLAALMPDAQVNAFVDRDLGPALLVVLLTAVIGAWLYSSVLHSSPWRATIGKRMLGICVADLDGRRITFRRASARHASTFLVWLSLGIGFAIIALPWRVGVHDLVAGTLVVRRRRVVDDPPEPIPAPEPYWRRQPWQPSASDSSLPVRLRLPAPAWWLRMFGVLWFACTVVFIALIIAGAPTTTVDVTAGVWVVLSAGVFPVTARQRRTRIAAMDAAMEAAFRGHRQRGEVLRGSSLVSVGVRPWLLELVLAHWLVRLILGQGCLLVTDRRLLLFRVNMAGTAIIRLDCVEQLDQVHIRTLSAGVFRPRLALIVATGPGLQFTFPFAWRSRAPTVAAAISRTAPSALV